jgi:hypothetical protein
VTGGDEPLRAAAARRTRPKRAKRLAVVLSEQLVGFVDENADGRYSLTYGVARLAPLYDLLSGLPYPDIWDPQATSVRRQPTLAMRIGGERRIYGIRRAQWESCAGEIGLDPEPALARLAQMAEAIPDVVSDVCRAVADEGFDAQVLGRIESGARRRAEQCTMLLGANT